MCLCRPRPDASGCRSSCHRMRSCVLHAAPRTVSCGLGPMIPTLPALNPEPSTPDPEPWADLPPVAGVPWGPPRVLHRQLRDLRLWGQRPPQAAAGRLLGVLLQRCGSPPCLDLPQGPGSRGLGSGRTPQAAVGHRQGVLLQPWAAQHGMPSTCGRCLDGQCKGMHTRPGQPAGACSVRARSEPQGMCRVCVRMLCVSPPVHRCGPGQAQPGPPRHRHDHEGGPARLNLKLVLT